MLFAGLWRRKEIMCTVAVDYLDASSTSHNQGMDICGFFHLCELWNGERDGHWW
jgi:hypothetical protein